MHKYFEQVIPRSYATAHYFKNISVQPHQNFIPGHISKFQKDASNEITWFDKFETMREINLLFFSFHFNFIVMLAYACNKNWAEMKRKSEKMLNRSKKKKQRLSLLFLFISFSFLIHSKRGRLLKTAKNSKKIPPNLQHKK